MNLAQLQQAVLKIYPTISSQTAYTTSFDSSGNAEIVLWNNSVGPQPTDAQLSSALSALQLEQAQAEQDSVLNAAYQTARFGTPVTITASSGATLTFPTGPDTQQDIMGYLVAYDATDAPSQLPLQDSSGVVQQLTYADLKTLAKSIANNSYTAWLKLQSLLGQVKAATTISAVQAVVWS